MSRAFSARGFGLLEFLGRCRRLLLTAAPLALIGDLEIARSLTFCSRFAVRSVREPRRNPAVPARLRQLRRRTQGDGYRRH